AGPGDRPGRGPAPPRAPAAGPSARPDPPSGPGAGRARAAPGPAGRPRRLVPLPRARAAVRSGRRAGRCPVRARPAGPSRRHRGPSHPGRGPAPSRRGRFRVYSWSAPAEAPAPTPGMSAPTDLSDVAAAYRLRHGDDKLARGTLEGRLLAGEPIPEVAAACGLTPGVVEAYHELFFDVRERLDAAAWV